MVEKRPSKKRAPAKSAAVSTPESQAQKAQKVAARLRALGGISYVGGENPYQHPSSEAISAVKAKILKGGDFDDNDRAIIPLIVEEFKGVSQVIRKLSEYPGLEGRWPTFILVHQTFENTAQIHKIDPRRVSRIASEMRSFPVLASPGGSSAKSVSAQLSHLGVGKDFQPGCYTTAKSPQDKFADIADEIVTSLQGHGLNIYAISEAVWPDFARMVRKDLLPRKLHEYPDHQELVKLIKSEADKKTEGRTVETIKERIMRRLQAKLGSGKDLG